MLMSVVFFVDDFLGKTEGWELKKLQQFAKVCSEISQREPLHIPNADAEWEGMPEGLADIDLFTKEFKKPLSNHQVLALFKVCYWRIMQKVKGKMIDPEEFYPSKDENFELGLKLYQKRL